MKKIIFGLASLTAGIALASNQLTTGELKMRTYYCDQAQNASFQGTVTGANGEQRSIFFLSGLSFSDSKDEKLKIRVNTDSVKLSDSGSITINGKEVGQISVADLKNKIQVACDKNNAEPRSIKNLAYDVPIQFNLSENATLYYRLKKNHSDCTWVGVFDPVHSFVTGRNSEKIISEITDAGGAVLDTKEVSSATRGCITGDTIDRGLLSVLQVAVISVRGLYYATFKTDSTSPEAIAAAMKADDEQRKKEEEKNEKK